MLLCNKDKADKVIDGTVDKLTLAQIKKRLNNLLDQIIDFKITNILNLLLFDLIIFYHSYVRYKICIHVHYKN